VGGLPPDVDEAEPYGPAAGQQPYGQVASVGTTPVAPTRTPAVSAAPVTSQASPPPLPRPRPKLAAAEPTAPVPAAASSKVAPVPIVTGSTVAPAATGSTVQPSGPAPSKSIGASAAAELPVYEPTYEQHE
jgi:hypothetical protein